MKMISGGRARKQSHGICISIFQLYLFKYRILLSEIKRKNPVFLSWPLFIFRSNYQTKWRFFNDFKFVRINTSLICVCSLA